MSSAQADGAAAKGRSSRRSSALVVESGQQQQGAQPDVAPLPAQGGAGAGSSSVSAHISLPADAGSEHGGGGISVVRTDSGTVRLGHKMAHPPMHRGL